MLGPMSDSSLPAMAPPVTPGFTGYAPTGAPAPISGFAQPIAPVARAPGRPNEDPIKAEDRLQRHADRKRLENVLPRKALDSKLLIYRRTADGRSGMRPGARALLTILVSELEEARAQQDQSSEDYINDRIMAKVGPERANGSYEVVTVDKRGQRINDIPPFNVTVGEEPASQNEASSDESGELSPSERDELHRLEMQERGMDEQAQFQQAAYPQGLPPQPTAIDLGRMDEFAKRNRDEAESKSTQSMALIMQVISQSQAAQQQAAAQQTRMFMAMIERMNHQPKQDVSGGTAAIIAALAPVLAPIVAKMVEPKQTDPIILELLRRNTDKTDPSAALLQQIPIILGKVAETQMALQSTGAKAAVEMQAEVNKAVMGNVLSSMKEAWRDSANLRAGKDDSDKGGSTAEMIGNIAAAVLPRLLGGQQAAAPEAVAEQPVALPAPQPIQQPAPQPTPEPVAAQPVPQPAPRPQPRRDAAARIRHMLHAVKDLRSGKLPAERRTELLQFIMKTSPPPMLAAIRASSFDDVVKAGTQAVLADADILQWIANADNQEFLKDILKDARLYEGGALTDEQLAAKISALKQAQQGSAAPIATVTPAPDTKPAEPIATPTAPGSSTSPPPATDPPAAV